MKEFVLRYPAAGARTVVSVRRGAVRGVGKWVRGVVGARRVAVVSDPRVMALHGERVVAGLRRVGIAADAVVMAEGERAKVMRTVLRLWDAFAALGLDRSAAVVALGGGVVGDVAGFAASTWLRGIAWVGLPSTVVAQVDSSIGGKTGVDLAAGKNLAGAFHHPAGVLVDVDLLQTLDEREYRAGMAEVIKTGFAVDRPLFEIVEHVSPRLLAREPRTLDDVVGRTLAAKGRIVQRDPNEREGGVRTALNFGHTLGHALESATGYRRFRHGEAVAIGMRAAAELSVRHARLAGAARDRLARSLDAWRLPGRIPRISAADLLRALAHDKKRRDARVRWVLTPRIGRASVPRLISERAVRALLLEFGATT